jgi:hypothetical protein
MSIDIISINNGKGRAIDLQTAGLPVTLKYNPTAPASTVGSQPCQASFTIYTWDGEHQDLKQVDPDIQWGPTPTDQKKKRAMVPGNGRYLIIPSFEQGDGHIEGVRASDRAPESCTFSTFSEAMGTQYSVTISLEDGNVPE